MTEWFWIGTTVGAYLLVFLTQWQNRGLLKLLDKYRADFSVVLDDMKRASDAIALLRECMDAYETQCLMWHRLFFTLLWFSTYAPRSKDERHDVHPET